MYISRSGLSKPSSIHFFNGSIKSGNEEDMDDEADKITPGPGEYLTADTSFIKKPNRNFYQV